MGRSEELSGSSGLSYRFCPVVSSICAVAAAGLVDDWLSVLRRKLGDDADNPTYIFTEPRVGYRYAEGGEEGNGRIVSAEPELSVRGKPSPGGSGRGP